MKIKTLTYSIALFAMGSLFITSCTNNDDSKPYYSYGFISAENINITSVQPVNKVTKVNVTFVLRNSCQEFLEFKDLNTSPSSDVKDVGIYGAQHNNVPCEQRIDTIVKQYDYIPKKAGENTIRFWTGTTQNKKHTFLEKEIVVPE